MKTATPKGESLMQRSHYAGALGQSLIDQKVTLCGWVHRRRDHGNLIFIDLRDRSGVAQVVFDPRETEAGHAVAETLRNEFVLAVQGVVRLRPEGMQNKNLATGMVEVVAHELRVFNPSAPPPFNLDTSNDSGTVINMKYRYLDLRRPDLQKNFQLRHEIVTHIRQTLNDEGFYDIETPFLTKSTPEGARDYLVPSRLYPGSFYALPQSPQLFKQLLMVAGFDRYYQIVRCFRDEDLRADRQPEFTQLDLEMSFVTAADVQTAIEKIFVRLFEKLLKQPLNLPLEHLTYQQAMEQYGSDKPDRRYGMVLQEAADIFATTEFRVVRDVLQAGGVVRGFAMPGGGKWSRTQLDKLVEVVAPLGFKGVLWFKRDGDNFQSPIAKFLNDDQKALLDERFQLRDGCAALLLAGERRATFSALGTLRLHMAQLLELKPDKAFDLFWVDDFPLFEPVGDHDDPLAEGAITSSHHPFTAPHPEDLERLETDPLSVRSTSYDLVMNGSELGSGSIRIHDNELQRRIFKLLKLSDDLIDQRFGFFLEALRYGTPPHGGIALGLDRLAMLFSGATSLREVIAFPKTQQGVCLTTDAPSLAGTRQLKELGITVPKPRKP